MDIWHNLTFSGPIVSNVFFTLFCTDHIWPFQLACLRKLMTTTRVGVNCNIRTSRFRQTPVHLAAFGGHPQCLLWLVSANADLDAQVSSASTVQRTTGVGVCIML